MLTSQQVWEFGEKKNWQGYINILKAQHPDLIEMLRTQYPGKKLSEAIWLYINQQTQPSCVVCGSPTRFRNVKQGYSIFCGNKQCSKTYRKTNSQLSQQLQQQSIEPPQCANPACSNLVTAKKTGVWAKHCSTACKGQHNSLKSREKAKETWQRTLGVDHPRQCPKINQRIKSQWIEKYGVDNPARLPEVMEKVANTKIQRYGQLGNNQFQLNPNLEILKDAKTLNNLYPKHTPHEIADQLGVHVYTVYRYLHHHGLMEPYRSSFERGVLEFLTSLGIENIQNNNRKILSGRELDIWIPDQNIAIECHGLYWHHDSLSHIDPNSHQRKFLECEQKGIHLISLFSDQWQNRRSVVERVLQAKLGQQKNSVGARKCTVSEIANRDLRPLLENNHIQGFAAAQKAVGLFYRGQLVAGMSFSLPRLGIGRHQKSQGVWELVRAVSSVRIPGGASKMLNHFVKTHQPVEIFSYSNNDWSNGNLYRQLGFELEHEVAPGYWYVPPNFGIRQHRFRFAKHRLVAEGYDPNLTEREIMAQRGYLRVWDCGKRRWNKRFS